MYQAEIYKYLSYIAVCENNASGIKRKACENKASGIKRKASVLAEDTCAADTLTNNLNRDFKKQEVQIISKAAPKCQYHFLVIPIFSFYTIVVFVCGISSHEYPIFIV